MEPITQKPCSKCKIIKPLSEFYNDKRSADGKYSSCKTCRKADNNPSYRRSYYMRLYGMTEIEYDQLLEFQEGKCFLCGKECSSGRKLSVDHDHDTGEVRGLLCIGCNKYRVGNLKRDQVAGILNYMDNPPARQLFGTVRVVPVGMEKPKRRRPRKRKRTK